MIDPLAVETGDHVARDVVALAPRQGRRLRGSLLLLLGIVVAPLVMAGYVGLTVLLFLPLLGLRWMFRGRSMPAVVRWDGHAGMANLWDAATRSA